MNQDDLHTSITRGVKTTTTPSCIGLIMDGNRRWAKRNGQTTSGGHMAGYRKLTSVVQWAKKEGIGCLVVYAFSTENWKRGDGEITDLMNLFRSFFKSYVSKAKQQNIRVTFIGERKKLPRDIQTGMARLERETAACTNLHLVVAAPYGSRSEILDAVNRIKERDTDGVITEEMLSQHLWTADIPDPDLVIRTGGRKRLSNFLLWQAAYAELFFTDTLWPDFTQKEFTKILYRFSLRERTVGK